MTLDPSVRAGWVAFSAPLEGVVPHIYQDTRGLVTVAIGALVDSPAAAAALTGWDNPGGVVADWHRVKAMPPGLVWTRYAAPSSPRLTPEGIDAVTGQRLDAAVEVLAAFWPDFGDWPAPAQAGALSLSWAVGAGKAQHGLTGPEWPHFQAAVRAGDWRGCAAAGQLKADGNAGVVPRNKANKVMFLLAAGLDLEVARAQAGIQGGPGRPTDEAALRALEAFPWARELPLRVPAEEAAVTPRSG